MSTPAAAWRLLLARTVRWTLAGGAAAASYHQYRWVSFRSCASADTPVGAPEESAGAVPPAIDKLGGYPLTAYNCDGVREPHALRPPLASHSLSDSHQSYDVCVIGGGYAGLHTALSLAERGKSVVVLEARRVGWAASGRNGGDAVVGFHTDAEELATLVGDDKARALYSQAVMGYARLKHLISRYRIQCDAKEEGSLTMAFARRFNLPPGHARRAIDSGVEARSASSGGEEGALPLAQELDEARAHCADMKRRFGEEIRVMTLPEISKRLGRVASDRYAYGVFNPMNLTLNPLELALGLARACAESKRVHIHELTPVVRLSRVESASVACGSKWLVESDVGSVRADEVVLATNGAPAHLSLRLSIATTPLSTGMLLTKPLPPALLDDCLTTRCAVFDERFALAYFRRVPGNRILFGSLASGLPYSQGKLRQLLLEDLAATFPPLAPYLDATVCWQGQIEARLPIFPVLGRDDAHDGLWYSFGFSGHGLVPTCAAGEILASAIASIDHVHDKQRRPRDRRYDLWAEVGFLTGAKRTPMPAGSLVRSAATAARLPPLARHELASLEGTSAAPSSSFSAANSTGDSGGDSGNVGGGSFPSALRWRDQPQQWRLCPVFPPAGGPWGLLATSVCCSLVGFLDKWESKY